MEFMMYMNVPCKIGLFKKFLKCLIGEKNESYTYVCVKI